MHLTIKRGVFIVAGITLTSKNDCTSLLIRLPSQNDSYILLGVGSGSGTAMLLRNIIELGVSIKAIKYVVIPYPSRCLAGACREFKELFPEIHIVSHPQYAQLLRNGIGIEGETYPPCPVSYVTDTISIDRAGISLIPIKNCTGLRVILYRDGVPFLSINIISIRVLGRCKDTEGFRTNEIVCLAEKPMCIQGY